MEYTGGAGLVLRRVWCGGGRAERQGVLGGGRLVRGSGVTLVPHRCSTLGRDSLGSTPRSSCTNEFG